MVHTYCRENLDERESDHGNWGGPVLMTIRRKTVLGRYVVTAPIKTKADRLRCGQRKRVTRVLQHLAANGLEGVSQDGRAGFTTCARPKLDVVPTRRIAPVVNHDLVASIIAKYDRKRRGRIRIGEGERLSRIVRFWRITPARLPAIRVGRAVRCTCNDPSLFQEPHDALDGRLRADGRHPKRRVSATVPIEGCERAPQQHIRHLQDTEAREHLARTQQIDRYGGLSHSQASVVVRTTRGTRSDPPPGELPPAMRAPRGRTVSAGVRSERRRLLPGIRAPREARPRNPQS